MDTTPRPKPRPETVIPIDDLELIERVVWAEANTEGREGRDAVRSVIFNRLKSGRFGDTVADVLTPDQFEPVSRYNGIRNIPVPDDHLQRGLEEMADYIQLGDDPTQGRTFFQNTQVTKRRGTEFDGQDPITIGNHTFYRGYGNQEPVTDTNFSHNIRVDYGDTYEMANLARGGFTRGRGGEGEDSEKFNRFRDRFERRKQAKRDEPVAIDIEQATAQPMSVEEKRAIESQVQTTADAAKASGVRNPLFAETDALINTPQEREKIDNAPDPSKPAMTTDVEPSTTKLPPMYDINPSGDAAPEDGQDINKLPMMSMNCGGAVDEYGSPVSGMMMPQAIVGFDPVSGNPIPLGSSAENVRDDIPAALSTGEYVMPADVVRWHGLKHIMDMYQEAKMGLMAMASIGQIKGIDDEYVFDGKESSDIHGDDEGHERHADETGSEEYAEHGDDGGVEYPEVEVIEEIYPLEGEDSVGVEAYPTEESGPYTVGDEQVLLIFQTPK